MGTSALNRRVILKPEGLGSDDAAKLRTALQSAVEFQRQLATTCPHVLTLVGDLDEDDRCYFVEHEPAEPISTEQLFEPSTARGELATLFRLARAVFAALHAAHTQESAGSSSHGAHAGLCPGVLLVDSDGIEKVSDFGFGRAVYEALGPDAYYNLAVGPREGASAAWEVLSPEEYERDDRICAFIAPSKYVPKTRGSFEASSDIISAGFLLYFFAEHRHPYFPGDSDVHRLPDVAAFMTSKTYAPRALKRAPDQERAAAGWAALVDRLADEASDAPSLIDRTLLRLPSERPTAAELVAALSKHIKPVELADVLRQRLITLCKHVRETDETLLDWKRVQRDAITIATHPATRGEVATRARALAAEAQASLLIPKAKEILTGPDWADARQLVETLTQLSDLREEPLLEEIRKISQILDRNVRAMQDLEAMEAHVATIDPNEPEAASSLIERLQARIDQLPPDKGLLQPVRVRRGTVQSELRRALADVRAEQERRRLAIEADHRKAEAYLADLNAARREGQWDRVEELVGLPPQLVHRPADFTERLEAVREALREQREREADHAAARRWVDDLLTAVAGQSWDRAETLLGPQRPRLTHWPKDVTEEEKQCRAAVREQRQREADDAAARKWWSQVEAGVAARRWSDAQRELRHKPELSYWPQDVVEQEAPLRAQVEQEVAAEEALRKRIADEHQQARQWLAAARAAADALDWDRALATLEQPPELEFFPEDVRGRADVLRTRVTEEKALAEAIAADRSVAEQYLDGLEDALQAQRWDDLERLLTQRVSIAHWPSDVTTREKAIKQQLAAQRQLEAEHRAYREWFDKFQTAVDAEQADAAEALWNQRPVRTSLPDELAAPIAASKARLDQLIHRRADHEAARRYVSSLRAAVQAEDWDKAAAALAKRPKLSEWPQPSVSEETALQARVEQRLDERRRIDEWLKSADEAAAREDYPEAIHLIESPPIDPLPDSRRDDVARRRTRYRDQLREQIQRMLAQRTKLVAAALDQWVRGLVARKFDGVLSAERVTTRIDAEEWLPGEPPTRGRAKLHVNIQPASGAKKVGFAVPFEFDTDGQRTRIANEAQLAEEVGHGFAEPMTRLQKSRLAEWGAALPTALLPNVKMQGDVTSPTATCTVVLNLLGGSWAGDRIECKLVWSPEQLTWRPADPARIREQGLKLAARGVEELMADLLAAHAAEFDAYRAMLNIRVAPASAAKPDELLPTSARLKVQLTIDAKLSGEAAALHTFEYTCREAGAKPTGVSLQPALQSLRRFLVERQQASLTAQAAQLRSMVEGSRAKRIELNLFPSEITELVDQVTFQLKRPDGTDRITFPSTWSTTALEFEIDAATREQIETFLGRAGSRKKWWKPTAGT